MDAGKPPSRTSRARSLSPPSPLWWIHHGTSSRKSALLPVAHHGKEGLQIQGPPTLLLFQMVLSSSTPQTRRDPQTQGALCAGDMSLVLSFSFSFCGLSNPLMSCPPLDRGIQSCRWPLRQLPRGGGAVTSTWGLMPTAVTLPTGRCQS